jgi:WD40 repeat protein
VVTVWNCSGKGPEGTTPLSLKGHRESVTCLTFQRQGPLLASGGADGLVALWHPGKLRKPLSIVGGPAPITCVVWRPDDRAVSAADEAGGVTVFAVY